MIAIDMDGTLLGDDGQVSPRNLAALLAAQAAGIEVVIATGRRHCYAMHILRPLGLHPATLLVSSNGAVTRTLGPPSQLIARTYVSRETSLWLCSYLAEYRDALVLTFDRTGPDGEDTCGALVVEQLDQLNASIGRWMTVNAPYIACINPIEQALTATPGEASDSDSEAPTLNLPIQAMLCGTAARMAQAEGRLLEHPGVIASDHPSGRSNQTPPTNLGAPHLESEMWNSSRETPGPTNQPILNLHRTVYPERDLSILDILPPGCSKGAALLALAETQGIAPEAILAIGDNWNDVSMLEIAGHAVLMENAPADLKAQAVTRGWRIGLTNSAHGVAEAIESLAEIEIAAGATG